MGRVSEMFLSGGSENEEEVDREMRIAYATQNFINDLDCLNLSDDVINEQLLFIKEQLGVKE